MDYKFYSEEQLEQLTSYALKMLDIIVEGSAAAGKSRYESDEYFMLSAISINAFAEMRRRKLAELRRREE